MHLFSGASTHVAEAAVEAVKAPAVHEEYAVRDFGTAAILIFEQKEGGVSEGAWVWRVCY